MKSDLCFLKSPKSLAAPPRPSPVHLQRLQPTLQDHWRLPNHCGGQAGVHQKGSLHRPKVRICGWRHRGEEAQGKQNSWQWEKRPRQDGVDSGHTCWGGLAPVALHPDPPLPHWSVGSHLHLPTSVTLKLSPHQDGRPVGQGARAPFCEVSLWPSHVPVTEPPGAGARKSTSDLPPC